MLTTKSVHAAKIYIDQAVRHVHLKQGFLGIEERVFPPVPGRFEGSFDMYRWNARLVCLNM